MVCSNTVFCKLQVYFMAENWEGVRVGMRRADVEAEDMDGTRS